MSSPVRHSRAEPAPAKARGGNPVQSLITDHLNIWAAAETPKKAGGRGRGAKTKKSPHGIKKLRELILELAVSGKLVPQDPNDEPASLLLKDIAKEKNRLVEKGVIRRPKEYSKVSEEEEQFDLPNSWQWERLPNMYYSISPSGKKLKSSEIAESGAFPVVDQGKSYIAGYTNETGLLIEVPGPIIIFGDHTTEKKYIDFDFVAGADGTKILRPYKMDERYFFTCLLSYKIESRGYARHFKVLNENLMPVPPLAEQHRIVAKVDELMALCDVLEQEQTESSQAHQTLVETLLATLTQIQHSGQPLTTDGGNAEHTAAQSGAAEWLRIAEHFDTLFTTEQSIDQLKKTILQLAVMGKLVPQNPNDEPASELLKKIAAEKARLIKEKKIKKQKNIPEVGDDEKPFELPRDWKWVRLGECVVLKSGTSFPKGRELEEGPVPYCKVGDMNMAKNLVDLTTSSRFIDPDERDLKQLIPAKSIAFPKRGGAIATNKKRYVIKELFVDLNVMVATPINPLSITYVMTWLDGIDLASLNTGTSVPQINNKDIEPLLFPCPPEAEQQRIVAKVDELVSICDTLKARLNESQTTQVQLADAIVERAVA